MWRDYEPLAIFAIATIPAALVASGGTYSSWLVAAGGVAIVVAMLLWVRGLRRRGQPDLAMVAAKSAWAVVGAQLVLGLLVLELYATCR